MSNKIFHSFGKSSIGKIGIASSSYGVVFVNIGEENTFLKKLKQKFPENQFIKSKKMNIGAINELNFYLKGNLKTFKSKLDLRGTSFQIKVWENTRKIPYGAMRSYKAIACEAGKPTASRAVGNAIANNPIPIFIPCD